MLFSKVLITILASSSLLSVPNHFKPQPHPVMVGTISKQTQLKHGLLNIINQQRHVRHRGKLRQASIQHPIKTITRTYRLPKHQKSTAINTALLNRFNDDVTNHRALQKLFLNRHFKHIQIQIHVTKAHHYQIKFQLK